MSATKDGARAAPYNIVSSLDTLYNSERPTERQISENPPDESYVLQRLDKSQREDAVALAHAFHKIDVDKYVRILSKEGEEFILSRDVAKSSRVLGVYLAHPPPLPQDGSPLQEHRCWAVEDEVLIIYNDAFYELGVDSASPFLESFLPISNWLNDGKKHTDASGDSPQDAPPEPPAAASASASAGDSNSPVVEADNSTSIVSNESAMEAGGGAPAGNPKGDRELSGTASEFLEPYETIKILREKRSKAGVGVTTTGTLLPAPFTLPEGQRYEEFFCTDKKKFANNYTAWGGYSDDIFQTNNPKVRVIVYRLDMHTCKLIRAYPKDENGVEIREEESEEETEDQKYERERQERACAYVEGNFNASKIEEKEDEKEKAEKEKKKKEKEFRIDVSGTEMQDIIRSLTVFPYVSPHFSRAVSTTIVFPHIPSVLVEILIRYLYYYHYYENRPENRTEFKIDPALAMDLVKVATLLKC